MQIFRDQISDRRDPGETWTLLFREDLRPLKGKDSTVEKRYWQLFNQTQLDSVWSHPNGSVLSRNPAAAEAFGYAFSGDFEGESFINHFRGDLEGRRRTAEQLRSEEEVNTWNPPVERRDGRPLTIPESLALHEDLGQDAPIVVSSFVEITQQARL